MYSPRLRAVQQLLASPLVAWQRGCYCAVHSLLDLVIVPRALSLSLSRRSKHRIVGMMKQRRLNHLLEHIGASPAAGGALGSTAGDYPVA